MDVRREYALVGFVDVDCGIGPPKKGLGDFRPVKHHSLDFEVSAARPQRETGHTFLMEHPLHLVGPDGHASVRILLDFEIDRKEGARTVMLGPVELDSTGNPGSGKAYERRLDDPVVIDEMALLDFVVSHLDPSPELGEDHHLDVFILQEDCKIFLVHLLPGDALDHGIGIDDSAGTLVHPLFEEDGILFRLAGLVGRDDHLFFPGLDHAILILIHFQVVPGTFLLSQADSCGGRRMPRSRLPCRSRKSRWYQGLCSAPGRKGSG